MSLLVQSTSSREECQRDRQISLLTRAGRCILQSLQIAWNSIQAASFCHPLQEGQMQDVNMSYIRIVGGSYRSRDTTRDSDTTTEVRKREQDRNQARTRVGDTTLAAGTLLQPLNSNAKSSNSRLSHVRSHRSLALGPQLCKGAAEGAAAAAACCAWLTRKAVIQHTSRCKIRVS